MSATIFHGWLNPPKLELSLINTLSYLWSKFEMSSLRFWVQNESADPFTGCVSKISTVWNSRFIMKLAVFYVYLEISLKPLEMARKFKMYQSCSRTRTLLVLYWFRKKRKNCCDLFRLKKRGINSVWISLTHPVLWIFALSLLFSYWFRWFRKNSKNCS